MLRRADQTTVKAEEQDKPAQTKPEAAGQNCHSARNKTFSKPWKYISKPLKYISKALKYISVPLKKFLSAGRRICIPCESNLYHWNKESPREGLIPRGRNEVELEGIEPSSKQGHPRLSTRLFRTSFSCTGKTRTTNHCLIL